MEKKLEGCLENIPLLLNGEVTRELFCISFNSDENWDVTTMLGNSLFFTSLMSATLQIIKISTSFLERKMFK
jgi:hypothetical protein